MIDDFRIIKIIFWVGCAIAALSFFGPFLDKETGINIYRDIVKEVLNQKLDLELVFIFFLLVCIISWIPLMAYAFHRYTLEKRRYTIQQRLINYFLFSIGFSAYILPTYLYYTDSFLFELIEWGYWLLMVCMTIMFVCYLIIQKKQLIDEDEISKHLVNND